ncbi:MAG: methylmalonyl-CoA epimerase [candidate division Zixibacteria bacterium]|nr:methylmalonyl-CoA epimerase [candidate division Zixibacteria bacterium]
MKLDKIEHIGIAVKDIGEVSKFYKDVFECQISEEIDVPERKIRIAFTEISGVKLEFVMPTDKESVVAKFIDKRGEGIHHICFEVEDVEKATTELKDKGVELVDDRPRMGAEGKKIVFIKPKSTHGVLVELKQKKALGS